MKLVIASNNPHKIAEIKTILQGKFQEIVSLEEMGIRCDPEETGETFLENALIKAQEVRKFTDLPILADDTGLCVNALGGRPGVHSARYASETVGQDHNYKANRDKLLLELDGQTNRTAYFQTVVVLCYPDGKTTIATGHVDGHILTAPDGENGFGYDSIFYCDELHKSFGTASAQEKNAVSHRGRALKNLLTQL